MLHTSFQPQQIVTPGAIMAQYVMPPRGYLDLIESTQTYLKVNNITADQIIMKSLSINSVSKGKSKIKLQLSGMIVLWKISKVQLSLRSRRGTSIIPAIVVLLTDTRIVLLLFHWRVAYDKEGFVLPIRVWTSGPLIHFS